MLSDGRVRLRQSADLFGRADVPLPDAAEAAAADAAARAQHEVPERVLMDAAGRAAALVLHALIPRGNITVVAGPGNNGGDGCVLARSLHSWGRDVVLVPAGRAPNAALLHGVALRIAHAEADARDAIAGAAVLVDAVLGTGARGAPREPAATWLHRIAAARARIVALDLPSGVDATSGAAHPHALHAALTITFGWPKLGLLRQPARQHCGRLVAVEIGFPPAVAADFGARLITPDWARARLPRRAPDAHKATAGRLLLVAGSHGMAGAAGIAAAAASAAGAGYVRVVSDEGNRAVLQTLVPEAVFHTGDVLDTLDARSVDALAIGPGLGQGPSAAALLDRALRRLPDAPAVLDADALNLLAADEAAVRSAIGSRAVVLTPHPGELGRLLDRPTAEIVADPPAAARAAAARFQAVVLLKGQPSMIAAPGAPLLVGTTGSSDLATAGMGDQLTGVIGALLAAGAAAPDAAAIGLFFSGRAADLAAHGRSLTPSSLSRHLRHAFRRPGAAAPPAGLPFVTFDQPPRR